MNIQQAEDRIKTLEKELAFQEKEAAEWKSMYLNVYNKLREERRFEAAKAAMQGILCEYSHREAYEDVSFMAVKHADALLKALEEKE